MSQAKSSSWALQVRINFVLHSAVSQPPSSLSPAEEGGGGKVILLERGAYKGLDACIMYVDSSYRPFRTPSPYFLDSFHSSSPCPGAIRPRDPQIPAASAQQLRCKKFMSSILATGEIQQSKRILIITLIQSPLHLAHSPTSYFIAIPTWSEFEFI
jgi:hypothetical protein